MIIPLVYPAADKEVAPSEDICVTDDLDAHLKYLTEGGKVLWFPSKDKHKDQTVGGLFQTDYWNYPYVPDYLRKLGPPSFSRYIGNLD